MFSVRFDRLYVDFAARRNRNIYIIRNILRLNLSMLYFLCFPGSDGDVDLRGPDSFDIS